MSNEQKLREALQRIQYKATSLADAQVIALEALALPTTEPWPLRAKVWRRESTQDWVLEIDGTINDTNMNCRHTQPLSVPIEDVPGLPTLYPDEPTTQAQEPSPATDDDMKMYNRIADNYFHSTQAQDLPDERAAFEAYFAWSRKSKGVNRRPTFELFPDGTYKDDHTQRHWWTWQQSRAALAAKPVPDDAELIDFLQSVARCDPKMDGNHVWWPLSWNTCQTIKGPTLREAIRAAIAAQGGQG